MRGQVDTRTDWATRLRLPANDQVFTELEQLKNLERIEGDPAPYLSSIDLYLSGVEDQRRRRSIWEEPEAEWIAGDFRIGETAHTDPAMPCGLSLDELARGVLIVGATGSGKTTIVIQLARQILSRGDLSMLFIDPKSDYGWLAREFPTVDVYRDNQLQLNLLEPPTGIPPELWFPRCAEIMASAFGLFEGSRSTLTSAIRHIAGLCNEVADEGVVGYPTCAHIRDLFSGGKPGQYGYHLPGGRTGSDYITRNRTRFENLCDTFPRMASISRGVQIDGTRPTVLDLSSVGQPTATKMLAESIIMRVYATRVLQGHRPKRIDLVVVIDEAQMLVGEGREWHETSSFPPMVELTTRCREFGIGLVYLAQSPSEIMRTVRANTSVQIVLPLNDGGDLDLMARSMSLSRDQSVDLRALQMGQGVVKKQGLPPFPMHADYEEADKDFNEADVAEHMAARMAEHDIIETPPLQELWQQAKKARAAASVAERGVELSSDEELILRYVLEKEPQCLGKTKLAQHSPLDRDVTGRLLDALAERRMLHRVRRKAAPGSGQGRARTVFYLDSDGAAYLALERHSHRAGSYGKGGWLHRTLMKEGTIWWQKCGYQATMEYPIGSSGETVDIVVEDGAASQRVAIEIECSSGQALANIAKCLVAGFSDIWIVPKNPGVRSFIERELRADRGLQNRATGRVHLFRDSSDLFGREEL